MFNMTSVRVQRRLVKAVEEIGGRCRRSSKGHWLVYGADGRWVTTIAGTTSDHRSYRNAIASLRRAGITFTG